MAIKRLIDANAILHDKVWLCGGFVGDLYSDGYMDALDKAETVIREFPTVDAVEVVHGRWLYDSGSEKYFCSACDEYALSFKKDTIYGDELYEVCFTDYCPNCGAKMDGDGNG